MAADKSDDPGVLGNLPRSRPGQRSDKRGAGRRAAAAGASSSESKPSPATRAKVTKAKAKAKSRAAAKPKPRAKAASAAAVKKTPSRPRTPASVAQRQQEHEPVTSLRDEAQSGSSDPITEAVKLAGKVVEAGLKTAAGIVKKLPGV